MTVPVFILGGFLGAGKTTLLRRILEEEHGQRLAVLVNDFGDLTIDADLVADVADDVVTFQNGCICCSVREDLLIAAQRLLRRHDGEGEALDGVIIETSGVSRPDVVAQTFAVHELSSSFRVQAVITVMDCAQYPDLDFDMGELALDQAAVADMVLLNKVDLVSDEALSALREEICEAIPFVRLVETVRANVPLSILFDVSHDAGKGKTVTSAASELFVSLAWRPEGRVSLKGIRDLLEALPSPVLRVKGWVEAQDGIWYLVQMVGRRGTVEPAANPTNHQPGLQIIAQNSVVTGFDPDVFFRPCLERDEEGVR